MGIIPTGKVERGGGSTSSIPNNSKREVQFERREKENDDFGDNVEENDMREIERMRTRSMDRNKKK